MNPEETKYTCDQCLPGANNMATITNLSDNLRWLLLNISAGMPDFRLRYRSRYIERRKLSLQRAAHVAVIRRKWVFHELTCALFASAHSA